MDLESTLQDTLAGRGDVHLALLFGSRATGRARPDSDVDVGVVAPGADLLQLAADLSRALGLEVEIVDLQRASVPLLDQVLRDGRVVHQGYRGAYGDWLGRTWMQQETDRPNYRTMRAAYLAHLAR